MNLGRVFDKGGKPVSNNKMIFFNIARIKEMRKNLPWEIRNLS